MRTVSFTLALLALATSALAANLDLSCNSAVELVPLPQRACEVPVAGSPGAAMLPEDTIEWFDSWTADGGGPIWYTPEDYCFNEGDTLELAHFVGLYCNLNLAHNLYRIDAFYLCGTSNPGGYVMTSGLIDFGPIPPNQPGYGWILGIGYIVPGVDVSIDWASRLMWGDAVADIGIPLSGRPDCVDLNCGG